MNDVFEMIDKRDQQRTIRVNLAAELAYRGRRGSSARHGPPDEPDLLAKPPRGLGVRALGQTNVRVVVRSREAKNVNGGKRHLGAGGVPLAVAVAADEV